MTSLLALSLHVAILAKQPTALTLVASLPLPVRAETSAFTVASDDELRVFVNEPNQAQTAQIVVRSLTATEHGPALPFVVAGVARCGHEIVATGSTSAAHPVVAVLGAHGKVARQTNIDAPSPIVWPVPVCLPGAAVAWQATPKRVETAEITADGTLGARRSWSVGEGPLRFASGNGKTWVAWAEPDAVAGVELTGGAAGKTFRVPAARPSDVAIGVCGQHACVAYAEGKRVSLARIDGAGKPARPIAIDLGDAAGGNLAVVGGAAEPIVWTQAVHYDQHDQPLWRWVLGRTDGGPLGPQPGLVHAVVRWRDRVAVIGTDTVEIFTIK